MNSIPLKAKIYIILVSISGIGVFAYSAVYASQDPSLLRAILGVTFAVAILDVIPIKPYGSSIEITISDSAKFAAVLMFPGPVAILATFLGTLIAEFASKRAWYKRLFNVSIMTLTISCVTAVYSLLIQPQFDVLGSPQNIVVLVLAGFVNLFANSVLVGTVISFTGGIPFRHVWMQNYPQLVLHDLTMIPLAVSVAILWRFSAYSIFLILLPLLVVRHSYETADNLQKQTEEALHAMMRIIDARDNETSEHSRRVSELSRSIARYLELPPADVEIIGAAASLHDLGKVGMPSDILFKTGKLTPEELARAQEHAGVGGELLRKFPLFEKGSVYVRHHHERFDGTGYPDGLMGEDIPLGSRIIAVADSIEAMTEDRPYRKAMTKSEAIAEMYRCSGTQFDPLVVHALMSILGKTSLGVAEAIKTNQIQQPA